MTLSTTHPLYDSHVEDWEDMRNSYRGERAIKELTYRYLPPTASQVLDGLGTKGLGLTAYRAYLARALFPDYVRDAVEALIGVMHSKPAKIELPKVMEPLLERCTVTGESLLALLRRINEEQLVSGRLGLMLDLPKVPDPANPMPYVAMYAGENVRNWDDGQQDDSTRKLNLVVLDESGFVRADFQWTEEERYRVLQLGVMAEDELIGVYAQALFIGQTYVEADLITPMLRGKTLDEVPFVFVNSKDVASEPDDPPLIGLARLAFSIFRSEADYRQNLYMQGQDTLVTIGLRHGVGGGGVGEHIDPNDEDALRTGAGARIDIDLGGDAKYIGVNSQGLAEQRQALAADHSRATTKAGQLMNSKGGSEESGEALKTRRAAQMATLTQLALTGAAGLQNLLRIAAKWLGANPEEVVVRPNLEFNDLSMAARELVDLMTARTLGAPLSLESIHALLVQRGITKMDYEDEKDLVEEEIADAIPPLVPSPDPSQQDPTVQDDPTQQDPAANKPGDVPPGNVK